MLTSKYPKWHCKDNKVLLSWLLTVFAFLIQPLSYVSRDYPTPVCRWRWLVQVRDRTLGFQPSVWHQNTSPNIRSRLLGAGQNLNGTRAGTIKRGAKTFYFLNEGMTFFPKRQIFPKTRCRYPVNFDRSLILMAHTSQWFRDLHDLYEIWKFGWLRCKWDHPLFSGGTWP